MSFLQNKTDQIFAKCINIINTNFCKIFCRMLKCTALHKAMPCTNWSQLLIASFN